MSRWIVATFAAASFAMLLTAFVWYDTSKPSTAPQTTTVPVEQFAKVMVVNRTLVTGSFLDKSSIEWKELSSLELAQLGSVFLQGVFDIDDVAGSIATQSILAETVISPDMLLHPDDAGFVSAIVTPGMRAISLRLDPTGAGFGLLRPGNNVDVLLTSQSDIEQDANGTPIYNNIAVETVLQNVRLLAIGNEFSPHQIDTETLNGYDPVAVTFEVIPSDAEKLVLASKLGELSLVLRSNQDQATTTHKPLKWAKDISGAYDLDNQPTQSATVIRGNTKDME